MGRRRKSSIFPPRSSSVEYPQEDDYSFYRDHLDKQTELGRRRIGDDDTESEGNVSPIYSTYGWSKNKDKNDNSSSDSRRSTLTESETSVFTNLKVN